MATGTKDARKRHLRIRDLPSANAVLAADLERDPEFRKEWQRLALGRAVAICLVQYRAKHDLSQTALAQRLGVAQPAVAALESGDRNPQLVVLARLSRALGLSFLIEIAPRRRRTPRWLTSAVERAPVVERVEAEGNRILVAAG